MNNSRSGIHTLIAFADAVHRGEWAGAVLNVDGDKWFMEPVSHAQQKRLCEDAKKHAADWIVATEAV